MWADLIVCVQVFSLPLLLLSVWGQVECVWQWQQLRRVGYTECFEGLLAGRTGSYMRLDTCCVILVLLSLKLVTLLLCIALCSM